MSRLADDLGFDINPTMKGENVKTTSDKLETYGIKDKEVDITPVVEVSTVVLASDTPIGTMEFFKERNTNSVLRSAEFPMKNKAYNISHIKVDVEIDLGVAGSETEPGVDSLVALQHFLKNSVLKTKLRRSEHLNVPLDQCTDYVIEKVGDDSRKRVVRIGFAIKEGIKINASGEFEATIHPAQGYKTPSTPSNPAPAEPHYVRVSLIGHSIQTPAA